MNRANLKIVIVGRNGQLAWEANQRFQALGQIICLGRPEFDLLDLNGVREQIRRVKPMVIVNAAAYTAVDQAESEPEAAMKVNSEAPAAIAEEAKRLGALFITYSTDYVFDGKSPMPYRESDPAAPLNVYGASKLSGEKAAEAVGGNHLIFRTSWVYGARGKNFLKTILKLAAERPELRIVDDQVGAPTWSGDLADATRKHYRAATDEVSVGEYPDRRSLGQSSWYLSHDCRWKSFMVRVCDGHRRRDRKARLVPGGLAMLCRYQVVNIQLLPRDRIIRGSAMRS